MQPRINIITLGVSDMNVALNFYEQGLNWQRSSASQGDIVFFPLGALVLGLYPLHKLAHEIGLKAKDKNDFSGITLAYNTKNKNQVDAIFAKIEHIGGTIIQPPKEMFWGGYSGYFADPDKHIFEIAYNPFVGFDEQNQIVL